MRWFEQQRLEWIGERVAEKGYINRRDLIDKFGISMPQASIDLRKFMEQMPDALTYNVKAKRYEARCLTR